MRSFLRSSIGKKVIIAITGLLLLGFLLAHLAGNLLIFRGPDALNAYAKKLRDLGPWLWVARIGLITAAIAHLGISILVTIENRRARQQRYAVYHSSKTTWAARTMMLSGALFLAYLVYHLLHFTFHVAHPALTRFTDGAGHPSVYAMVVMSFRRWPIVAAYVLGVGIVCVHLSHGIASGVQTLGLNNERTLRVVAHLARLLALAIFLGYVSIPAAVMCGVVGRDLVVAFTETSR